MITPVTRRPGVAGRVLNQLLRPALNDGQELDAARVAAELGRSLSAAAGSASWGHLPAGGQAAGGEAALPLSPSSFSYGHSQSPAGDRHSSQLTYQHSQPCALIPAQSYKRHLSSFTNGVTSSGLLCRAQSTRQALHVSHGQHRGQGQGQQYLVHARHYHPWYYGSKLRNLAIRQATTLDDVEALLREQGHKLDHVNLARLLRQLRLAAAEGLAEAEAEATAAAGPTGGAAAVPSPSAAAVAAAVAAAAVRGVRERTAALTAEAVRLVGRRKKWYDPRHAALVVARTAALRHTDVRLLHTMCGRVLDRLPEAYSRDLLLLLRGLQAHRQLSLQQQSANKQVAASSEAGGADAVQGRRLTRYDGPPSGLMYGVRRFLLAKMPTGRMAPEVIDGLLRSYRALHIRGTLGAPLCAAAAADLSARLPIYAPVPLAGVLCTLASESYPLPPPLLDAAAGQFAVHAVQYGNGAAAAKFLGAAAALLRQAERQQRQLAAAAEGKDTEGGAGGGEVWRGQVPKPEAWVKAKEQLLAVCLQLMARDASSATPAQLASYMQALARIRAPLRDLASAAPAAQPSTSTSEGPSLESAAAQFLSAYGSAVQHALTKLPPDSMQQLRRSYQSLGLAAPAGLLGAGGAGSTGPAAAAAAAAQ